MKCLLGLGNPGRRYVLTRHNVGFMVLDRVCQTLKLNYSEQGFSNLALGAVPCEIKAGGSVKVLLVKPAVYMNRSGIAVAELLADFPVRIQDILVVHDDMDIPYGAIRFKRGGSSGGHKGVQSIIESIGDSGFPRLKLGIGRPDRGVDPAFHVLSEFQDNDSFSSVIETAACAAMTALISGLDQAMNRYHGNSVFEEIEHK